MRSWVRGPPGVGSLLLSSWWSILFVLDTKSSEVEATELFPSQIRVWANGLTSPGASRIRGRPRLRFMINGSTLVFCKSLKITDKFINCSKVWICRAFPWWRRDTKTIRKSAIITNFSKTLKLNFQKNKTYSDFCGIKSIFGFLGLPGQLELLAADEDEGIAFVTLETDPEISKIQDS